eukprot:CAMPEP_0177400282 /NCGR_PEP_ID=MMETSP0368-20130122/59002_1 /TAXON_ID=447022 ORGANISM="Scrippsiella hangoei-like, Strain SHHI-4" /NCGR_SAMPLE_ID=MMETSP0368 /ASSEMBLY_ACC=CAM_ASM_000363 /LENGTH=50 /DNA_ID=CAMNT_0018867723 /DNA_START=59 /DNA_END=211 /DNA_ORIENTATION=-
MVVCGLGQGAIADASADAIAPAAAVHRAIPGLQELSMLQRSWTHLLSEGY